MKIKLDGQAAFHAWAEHISTALELDKLGVSSQLKWKKVELAVAKKVLRQLKNKNTDCSSEVKESMKIPITLGGDSQLLLMERSQR